MRFDPSDERWDAFVRSHPASAVYHLGAWSEILGRAYGFKSRYLAIERGGELHGVLPLMYSRGIISGPRLRSLPIVHAAGPLGRTPEDERLLIEEACALTHREAKLLIIRSRDETLAELVPALTQGRAPSKWLVDLASVPEIDPAAWKKRAPHLVRNLRAAEKAGVTFRETRSEADLRRFYRLYLDVMRRRRVLPRSYRQLALTRELLPEYRLFAVEREGTCAAATLCYAYKETVEIHYSASDSAHLSARPNHALWWGVVAWAAEHGFREVDLGEATEGTELERFKRQFLAEPVGDFRYDYLIDPSGTRADRLRRGSVQLGGAGTKRSRRAELVTRAWGRTPLGVTRALGKIVMRYA